MNLQSSLTSLREDRATYTSELKIPSQAVPMTFVHGTEVRIALGSNDSPMLLLPVSTEELRQKLPEADGLAMAFARYKVTSASSGYFLQVSNAEDKLESVFLDLVENICSRIQKGEGGYSAVVRAIEEFRYLLSRVRVPVDRNRIVGLIGELFFLRRAFEYNSEAISCWTGPNCARRDFLFARAAFEIKTTERSTGRNIVVHSLAQLDSDDADDLFLMFYRVEENPAKGVTVGDLVSEIRNTLTSSEQFEEKLKAVGFVPAAEDSWNIIRWVLLDEQPYRVAEGFPRIIAASFVDGAPVGVSGVNYQVDLDSAGAYAVSVQSLGDWLKQ